ncbi:MAG: T9SS type A sorting domain-containing protein [Candidatus Eisenbacteria bacterium]|nr:T9SS type A sorting domain-containing protein [Candidatus Eisenbacteria bacterium]
MRILASAAVCLLFASSAPPAQAAWPNSPFTNLPLSTAANEQSYPTIASDGAGGAIVTWQDFRSGTNSDIYAQHVLASGAVDPAWPANGRALCTAASNQASPTIASDGAGGAIVTWYDLRSGNNDIYAQHVLASGAVDPAWPANGRALCTAASSQSSPTIVADGAGGAIVTWYDYRSGTNSDIYAQHVLASGAVDPAWPADGRALCAAADDQYYPQIVVDGAGGAIVTWYDLRSGNNDIYAQHVLASGAVDPAWPANGRALCTAASDQASPMIASDGASGAIVTWYDLRSGNYDIYAQHVLASGAVDPAWPADGRALCTATSDQASPMIASDGAGGAIVTWYDSRGGNSDIYAQHVLGSGVADPAWPGDGQAVCTTTNDQYSPKIVADGAGGAIVTWQDKRGGTNYDIYAQRIGRHGYLGTPEPEMVAVGDVANDQGGQVKVSWNASWLDLASNPELDAYDVLRSVPTSFAAQAAARGLRVRALTSGSAPPEPGDLVALPMNGTTYYWEYLTEITPRHYLAGYSYVAATLGDSIAGSNPGTAFMVVARNSAITMWWPSLPMSGYSVDNLAPVAPAPFTGEYAGGATNLHWRPNAEADLAGYRLYRGTSAAFVPDGASLVAALADTGYADAGAAGRWYKLTAVDVHGNESPVATLSPSGTLAVDGSGAAALAFAPPSPNPANARTVLRYTLPAAGAVKLAIYDAAGRQVRVLAAGPREAGEHAEAWDLRDEGGRAVRAGLYFARFEAAGVARVHRVAVTR